MKFYTFALIALPLFAQSAQAQFSINDNDLGGGHVLRQSRIMKDGNLLKPDRMVDGSAVPGLAIQFVRMVKDVETPVEGLSFKAQVKDDGSMMVYKSDAQGVVREPGCKKSAISFSIPLASDKFRVGTGSADYQVSITAKCGLEQKFIFDEKSDNGQAIAIWQTAVKAGKKLAQTVGTQFWKRTIRFVWPANGDYYSSDTVNLTLGYQWDVVAHEMGHAIYDQAVIGQFGGGQHYIDRCYSETLALSEGWASFFSAFVNVDLKDVDAKFEYMVPRRAPIRFENIPSDVCGSPTNEWRVTGFLWDLIDYHDDGETLNEPFARLWNDTAGAHASSLTSMKARLIQKGWDAGKVETIWKLNFPAE